MDGASGRARWGWGPAALALVFASCGPNEPAGAPPSPADTLAAAGVRLSRSSSAGDLTAMAARGGRVLAALTRAERDALGRGALGFRTARAADVSVAVPRGSAPFWLAEQGFARTGVTLDDPDVSWEVYRKRFAAGWVGLGVNGLDATPKAHYAVFLRAVDGGPVSVDGLDDPGWESVWVTGPVALERDVLRPVRALPASLTGSTLLRTRHDRRHETRLARGRVWKTHVPSDPAPDQVVVSFGEDAATGLVWTWRTGPGVRSLPLHVRRAGGTGGEAQTVPSTSEEVRVPELLNDPVIRRHTARVAGLAPGTAYEYAIGEKTATAWTAVRTAPGPGTDASLLYLGDPQCGLEGWGKLLESAHRRRPDVSAVLIAGDLVDRGNERSNWDHFFLRAAGVFPRVAVMPAAGNHEYLDRGPRLYRATFALPANGPAGVAPDLVYSFEVGDVFVAVLDSTSAVTDPDCARLQAEWLDDRLARTRRRWKLVMFHHPVYASHPTRENPSLFDAWAPVFDRREVDLVLQGHDHAYLRTYPLRHGRRAEGGTVYVVSVSGDKYCDQRPHDTTEVGFTHVSTYQTIDVPAGGDRLIFRALDAAGRERDAFTLRRPAPTPPPRLARGSHAR